MSYIGEDDMKAIILAAGKGTRLKQYTEGLPKGMLEFAGKTLIERQIDAYRRNGISDISIVTGYASDKINYQGVNYLHNADYNSTNMVETLWRARIKLTGEVIVSYSDIIFEDRLLKASITDQREVGVVVDTAWKEYWQLRHGSDQVDIESLAVDENGNITGLGKDVENNKGIDGRYVGLIHFSPAGIEEMVDLYNKSRENHWNKPWGTSGNLFQKAYMTDLLQEMIKKGVEVAAVLVEHGWLEFDTVEDYEKIKEAHKNGNLEHICRV